MLKRLLRDLLESRAEREHRFELAVALEAARREKMRAVQESPESRRERLHDLVYQFGGWYATHQLLLEMEQKERNWMLNHDPTGTFEASLGRPKKG